LVHLSLLSDSSNSNAPILAISPFETLTSLLFPASVLKFAVTSDISSSSSCTSSSSSGPCNFFEMSAIFRI